MRAKVTSEADANSRTGKKRALEVIQKLAKDLVDLNEGDFTSLDLDEEVRKQVEFTRSLTSHTAKRRQLRFLARFLADTDHLSVQRSMALLKTGKREGNDRFKKLEEYRERLIKGDEATVEEIGNDLPGCDLKQLRKLQLQSQKELKESKGVTAARALFRYLRQVAEKS